MQDTPKWQRLISRMQEGESPEVRLNQILIYIWATYFCIVEFKFFVLTFNTFTSDLWMYYWRKKAPSERSDSDISENDQDAPNRKRFMLKI